MSSFTIPTSAYNTYPATPKYSMGMPQSEIWNSIKDKSATGITSVVGLCAYPQHIFELNYKLLRSNADAGLQTIMGFYNQQHGDAIPFNFLHPYDNTATAALFGTGDGVSTMFQLFRAWGGFYEPVLAPYGAAKVYVNAAEKTATTDFTISTSGLVTFTTAPALNYPLTWTGTFYWMCRFSEMTADFECFCNNLWKFGKVTIETIKKPGLA
jgi:uncharacterized protein (TIGR02217 family)